MLAASPSWELPEFQRDDAPADGLPIWRELFCTLEAVLLHVAPVYYGLGVPKGDGSGVIVIPGFLGTDTLLTELYAWLYRMDYRPYFSGIGINADCPHMLIRSRLNQAIDKARRETGRRVHIIGHSLGGLIAIAAGAQRPDDIASVITLASPVRGKAAHPNVLRLAEYVRGAIQQRYGDAVLPTCYTGHCSCDFVDCLKRDLPPRVRRTAIYTRADAIVDWKYCLTGNPKSDVQVDGTHIGLIFNPTVYSIIATRLAEAHAAESAQILPFPKAADARMRLLRVGS